MNGRNSPIIYTVLVGIISLISMSIYVYNGLGGEFSYYLLTSKVFGVPQELATRGIEPMYFGNNELGWDGQFYYYISNDLLGTKDTISHIDSPSYRYQRIGSPLFVALFSKLAFQSWVSPTTYYVTYLLLLLTAVWFSIRIFGLLGGIRWTGILWSIAAGAQVTLLNGLPDAAADAFLILSVFSLLLGRHWIGAFLLTFASLSREAYVIFPATHIGLLLYKHISSHEGGFLPRITQAMKAPEIFSLLIPIIVFLFWQIYVRHHFGASPTSQAHGVLGPPFVAWWEAVSSGLSGKHILVPPGAFSYAEAIQQLIFMTVIMLCLFLSVKAVKKNKDSLIIIRSLALGAIVLGSLYICFGRTVSMHYTGYMKACNLFFFLIPLFIVYIHVSAAKSRLIYFFLVIAILFSDGWLWKDRILSDTGRELTPYTRMSEVTNYQESPCLDNYDATVKLLGLAESAPKLIYPKDRASIIFWIELSNTSKSPFVTSRAKGSVNMSYHWLSEDGSIVIKDGIRSMIPDGIPPGSTVTVPVVVKFPDTTGRYKIRFSPVQEGCAWFYQVNPNSKLDIPFTIMN